MSENPFQPPASTPVHADVESALSDALEDFLAGAALNERTVEIWQRPAYARQAQELLAEIEALEEQQQEDGVETELGGGEIAEKQRRCRELLDMAGRSTWTVRAMLEGDDEAVTGGDEECGVEGIGKAPAEPEAPKRPELPKGATEQQRKSYTIAVKKYETEVLPAYEAEYEQYKTALEAWNKAYMRHMIARCVVKIEFADGRVAHSITPAQVDRLGAEMGSVQLIKLNTAINQATWEEPQVSVPFSQTSSSDDPMS